MGLFPHLCFCKRVTYTPTAQQAEAMDVNDSGSVDMTDYLMIRRYVMRTYYFVP